MPHRRVPEMSDVSSTLTDLVGRTVTARPASPEQPPCAGGRMVASYVDPEENLHAVWEFDLALAAALGASLTLLSPANVTQATQRGQLEDTLLDNFREVCNVLVALVSPPTLPALSFSDAYHSTGVPDGLRESMKTAAGRLDVVLAIEGYGGGVATLRTLTPETAPAPAPAPDVDV